MTVPLIPEAGGFLQLPESSWIPAAKSPEIWGLTRSFPDFHGISAVESRTFEPNLQLRIHIRIRTFESRRVGFEIRRNSKVRQHCSASLNELANNK